MAKSSAGHGGRRVGSGRKPVPAHLRAIDGGAGHRTPAREVLTGVPTTNASTAIAEVEEFDAPDDLSAEARGVWLKLAPLAFKRRTLTRATAYAFELLCRNIVLERRFADSVTEAGSAGHRGMIQRVENGLSAFELRPFGKPILDPEDQTAKPANPLDRFLKRSTS